MKRTAATALVLACLAASADLPSMQDRMLQAHNAVRASVGQKPLIWSEKLAQAAQQWADQLIKDGTFHHRPRSPWGQNLYTVTGGEFVPEQIMKGWAAEAKDYDYAANHCKPERICGHYTQIVWHDAHELGCALAKGGSREVWVCEYSPPGNYVGMRPY
jgi:pathogenesis-related protein 1